MAEILIPTEAQPTEPAPADVIARVAALWKVPIEVLMGRRRARRTVLCRRACIAALRENCPTLGPEGWGAALGLDHSTVIFHVKKLDSMLRIRRARA